MTKETQLSKFKEWLDYCGIDYEVNEFPGAYEVIIPDAGFWANQKRPDEAYFLFNKTENGERIISISCRQYFYFSSREDEIAITPKLNKGEQSC